MEGEFTRQKSVLPHQSLWALVSSTPREFQVQITDVYFEGLPFEDPADIIEFSFLNPQAPGPPKWAINSTGAGRTSVTGLARPIFGSFTERSQTFQD